MKKYLGFGRDELLVEGFDSELFLVRIPFGKQHFGEGALPDDLEVREVLREVVEHAALLEALVPGLAQVPAQRVEDEEALVVRENQAKLLVGALQLVVVRVVQDLDFYTV